ncbi:hypothetical protein BGW80DRAFT_1458600 [Lactifluus volemus]|nr:hypothetical protein BGW80DRAFT_1458600 [Lactifluus volemus]
MSTTLSQNGGQTATISCPASRCPLPAWSRTFSSADALLDHARQTRTLHPLCTTCNRVFKDTAALDQHVEAKHVVLCQPCNRKYKSQSALDQHWRASTAHPNCPICEAGAPDTNALAETLTRQHIANAHPKPSRVRQCIVGFATEVELTAHNSELHSELQCRICDAQFPSEEVLRAHTSDLSNHSRCEFCSAQFKDTSALVEHFTETHLHRDDAQDASRHSRVESSSTALSPSPPMSQSSIPSSRPTFSVIGSGRATAGRPEPPSHASTSVSDISSDIYRSPPSMGTTFTSSSPSLNGNSSNISHLQHFHGLPVRSPRPSTPPPPHPQHPNANFSTYTSGAAAANPHPRLAHASSEAAFITATPQLSSSPSPRRLIPSPSAHALLHARLQSRQAQQQQQPQPPSSVRSKTSVAETPSGDLANFHLLSGSPLQSVADLDTPTPSPRTPSMPSVSPADAQAYALASHNGGGAYLPLTTFLPGSSVSPPSGEGRGQWLRRQLSNRSFIAECAGQILVLKLRQPAVGTYFATNAS